MISSAASRRFRSVSFNFGIFSLRDFTLPL
jgi:hypothetical protein